MSPLSDTTNLAPAIAGTDVFKHIGAMMYTAVPVYLICLVIYSIIGFQYTNVELDIEGIAEIQAAISGTFTVSPIVLIPLIVVLILSICKFPAIPSLLIGIIVSYPIAAIYQGAHISSFFDVLNNGNVYSTGVEIVDELLNRGGMQEMMWTFSLGILALILGGLITMSGILKVLIGKIITRLPSRRLLPACTIFTGVAGCACLGRTVHEHCTDGRIVQRRLPGKWPETPDALPLCGGKCHRHSTFIPLDYLRSFHVCITGYFTVCVRPLRIRELADPSGRYSVATDRSYSPN